MPHLSFAELMMLSGMPGMYHACCDSDSEPEVLPGTTRLPHGGASITEIDDDDFGDESYTDSKNGAPRIPPVNPDVYKYVEISSTHSGDYSFSQPGGKPLPGLLSNRLSAKGRARMQQAVLFKNTLAVNLRQMSNSSGLPSIIKLFPNVTTIVRNCSIPLLVPIPILVDHYCLTKDIGLWKFQPELQALGRDLRPPTAKLSRSKNGSRLAKHAIVVEYYPGHPLLASADIEISLPAAGTRELVFLFPRMNTNEASPGPCRPSSQPCGMLHGVVKALASNMAQKYILVGADDIPRAAINLKKGESRKAKIFKEVKREMGEGEKGEPAEFIEFLSLGEYRRRVGEFQYKVETEP